MKKIMIGATVVILSVYLVFVIVAQVLPYLQWIVQRGEEARLEFDSVEALVQSGDVSDAAKGWLQLPDPSTYPADVKLASVSYRDDGLTAPQVTIAYVRGGSRYMQYSVGGNYELPNHEKLKSVTLQASKGELLVGRDNTVIIKWRDPEGPPYRYLYYYDPGLDETDMVRIAAGVAAAASPLKFIE
jgi:hypothetical protein